MLCWVTLGQQPVSNNTTLWLWVPALAGTTVEYADKVAQ